MDKHGVSVTIELDPQGVHSIGNFQKLLPCEVNKQPYCIFLLEETAIKLRNSNTWKNISQESDLRIFLEREGFLPKLNGIFRK